MKINIKYIPSSFEKYEVCMGKDYLPLLNFPHNLITATRVSSNARTDRLTLTQHFVSPYGVIVWKGYKYYINISP